MNNEQAQTEIIISEFLGHFSPANSILMETIIRQGLVPIKSVRNYNMVIHIKKFMIDKNFSYAKSVHLVARKYRITPRRVRVIYAGNLKYNLINGKKTGG